MLGATVRVVGPSRSDGFRGLPGHDAAGDGGRRDGVRRSEVQLARSRAPREVPVDRRDGDLIARARDAGTRVDACATRWLDERRADLAKDPVVALLLAVAEYFLGAA